MRDIVSDVKVSRLVSPAAIINANGTTTSQIINRADFDALVFLIALGAITDGQWVVTVFESDDSGMAGETAVAAADLLGLAGAATLTIVVGDANKVKKIGYKGAKQYTRIKAVQSGATTGGFFTALAEQRKAKIAPLGQS